MWNKCAPSICLNLFLINQAVCGLTLSCWIKSRPRLTKAGYYVYSLPYMCSNFWRYGLALIARDCMEHARNSTRKRWRFVIFFALLKWVRTNIKSAIIYGKSEWIYLNHCDQNLIKCLHVIAQKNLISCIWITDLFRCISINVTKIYLSVSERMWSRSGSLYLCQFNQNKNQYIWNTVVKNDSTYPYVIKIWFYISK